MVWKYSSVAQCCRANIGFRTRQIDAVTLQHYLPEMSSYLPALVKTSKSKSDFSSEREILYKVLFDMQRDINDLKSLTLELLKSGDIDNVEKEHSGLIEQIYENFDAKPQGETTVKPNIELLDVPTSQEKQQVSYDYAEEVEEEESLSLQEKELELIKRSLKKHDGRRKAAAEELGISERTLYRKIKQYDL